MERPDGITSLAVAPENAASLVARLMEDLDEGEVYDPEFDSNSIAPALLDMNGELRSSRIVVPPRRPAAAHRARESRAGRRGVRLRQPGKSPAARTLYRRPRQRAACFVLPDGPAPAGADARCGRNDDGGHGARPHRQADHAAPRPYEHAAASPAAGGGAIRWSSRQIASTSPPSRASPGAAARSSPQTAR